MSLAERIKSWREWAGLTATQLAAKCDVTPSAVYYWELGDHEPTHAHIDKITEAVGVSLSLFYGDPPKSRRVSA